MQASFVENYPGIRKRIFVMDSRKPSNIFVSGWDRGTSRIKMQGMRWFESKRMARASIPGHSSINLGRPGVNPSHQIFHIRESLL